MITSTTFGSNHNEEPVIIFGKKRKEDMSKLTGMHVTLQLDRDFNRYICNIKIEDGSFKCNGKEFSSRSCQANSHSDYPDYVILDMKDIVGDIPITNKDLKDGFEKFNIYAEEFGSHMPIDIIGISDISYDLDPGEDKKIITEHAPKDIINEVNKLLEASLGMER